MRVGRKIDLISGMWDGYELEEVVEEGGFGGV